MVKEVTVNSAGVSVTNGVAKFHTSNETGEKAGFTKLPIAIPGNHQGWSGEFAFHVFKSPVTKVEAARHLMTLKAFQNATMQAELTKVVAGSVKPVKAPKVPKAAKAPKTPKAAKAAGAAIAKAADAMVARDQASKPKIDPAAIEKLKNLHNSSLAKAAKKN